MVSTIPKAERFGVSAPKKEPRVINSLKYADSVEPVLSQIGYWSNNYEEKWRRIDIAGACTHGNFARIKMLDVEPARKIGHKPSEVDHLHC